MAAQMCRNEPGGAGLLARGWRQHRNHLRETSALARQAAEYGDKRLNIDRIVQCRQTD